MKMTKEEKDYMTNHVFFAKILQFMTEYNFMIFLYVLKTNHVGKKNAATSKKIYGEVFSDEYVYEQVRIANNDLFVMDKSSQFREGIKRFIAVQDEDMDTIYDLLGPDAVKLSKEEKRDLERLIFNLSEIFHGILGGRISYTVLEKSNSANRQRFYYFIPDADESIMHLMDGMILCNQLISMPIKYELLNMMRIMNPSCENPLEDSTYTPDRTKKTKLPKDSEVFLENVTKLYRAIKGSFQVQVAYGIYRGESVDGEGEKNSKQGVEFVMRSEAIINPFALLWNNGHYYLIASIKGTKRHTHYRVDRIISVASVVDETGARVKRESIPEILLPYYEHGDGVELEGFQVERYLHEHPDMRLYGKDNKIRCVFEVIDWELQMMVDTFGTDIEVRQKLDEKNKPMTRVDYYGVDKPLYEVTVKQVQYENALAFALTHAEYITVRAPKALVEDVRQGLTKMLSRL